MKKLALIPVLLLLSLGAGAAETIKEFRGTGNTTTSIFTVESPWLLDWRLDGDYEQLIALDITLVEAHSLSSLAAGASPGPVTSPSLSRLDSKRPIGFKRHEVLRANTA